MNSLRVLVYCFERAVGGFRRHPGTTTAIVGTIAVGFFMIGLVHVVIQMATDATSSWRRTRLVMYLADHVSPERADEMRSAAARLPGVDRVELVSSEETMRRFTESLGADDALVDGLESTVLPASLEITLRPGLHEIAGIAPVVERLRADPEIDDVALDDQWDATLSAARDGFGYTRALVFLFILLGCGFLTQITMGARFLPRVREASVARLFGASTAFVRGPLLLEGALQGTLGAGLAAVGLWLSLDSTTSGIRAALGPVVGAEMAVLSGWQVAGFIAAGAAFGGLCAWLATRRHASA